TQVNYIIWRSVDSLQNILIDSGEKFETFLQQELLGETAPSSRDLTCIQYVSQAFYLVMYRILYEKHLSLEKLQTVKAILTEFKALLYTRLFGNTWINRRDYIDEKIESISTSVMYLKEATNTTFVEAFYVNVTIDESNFINNVISIKKDAFAKLLKSTMDYTKAVDPTRPQEFLMMLISHLPEMQLTSVAVQRPLFC
ncbi:unnamed protein product, partial [Candidula unifasciata]